MFNDSQKILRNQVTRSVFCNSKLTSIFFLKACRLTKPCELIIFYDSGNLFIYCWWQFANWNNFLTFLSPGIVNHILCSELLKAQLLRQRSSQKATDEEMKFSKVCLFSLTRRRNISSEMGFYARPNNCIKCWVEFWCANYLSRYGFLRKHHCQKTLCFWAMWIQR